MKPPTPKAMMLALLLAALVALPALVPPAAAQGGGTTRALTISTASAGPLVPFQAFDASPPKAFDFNGDGKKEIIAQNDNRYVYVFDSVSGKILAQLTTKYPFGWGARPLNGPEASILNVGGVPHLIVANSASFITSFRFEPASSNAGNFVFTKVWERRLNDCFVDAAMDSKPVLADLTGDGRLEILGYTEESGIFALRADGSILWKRCIGGGNSEPAVADLNFDGIPEVVVASDGGLVSTLDGRNGNTKWTFSASAPQFNLGVASMPVGPSIGQIDGVGPLDIAVGARDTHDRVDFTKDHAALFAINGNGGLIWMRQDPDGAPLTYTHPIIHDVDGDGKADVLWADWNTIGHKPPDKEEDAWKVTGPAHFYRYDSAGNLRWRQTMNTYWNNKDLALADVDADGVQEVLANGPGGLGDGIWYLDSRTGAKETFVTTHPWKVTRGPIVEDLWGTGTMQWVVPVEAATSSVSGGAILVYDTHVPYNAAWPHLPYPDPGDGGGTPPPPPPPPPPGGAFQATFSLKNPNEWWQEVFVTPDDARVLSKVEVSINGGSPRAMTLREWDAWTSSYNTPKGSKVVFVATDPFGNKATSPVFDWLSNGTSPPAGNFTATFTLSPNVNNYWVEVGVASSRTVSTVSVAVDGGTPTPLAMTAWGTWARSLFVPTGASVVFIARDPTGAVAQSQAFPWLGGAPPPPPSGTFTATFTIPSGVNNFWVEVAVKSTHNVASVSAVVNHGSPVALAKTSWGTWAKSFFVPTGATVVFRATNATGTVAQSQPVSWLGGAPPPPGGDFTATFTVPSGINNWWVEVKVTGSHGVAGVSAVVNGGTPVPLAMTTWGTWARSFFVPSGASVVFRATDAGGAVAQSQAFTWP